ncbi:MAG: hypothetical protein ABH986_06830 [archaeon]
MKHRKQIKARTLPTIQSDLLTRLLTQFPTAPYRVIIQKAKEQGKRIPLGTVQSRKYYLREKGIISTELSEAGRHTKAFDFNGNLTPKARVRKAFYESRGRKKREEIAKQTGTYIKLVYEVKNEMREEIKLLQAMLIKMQKESKPKEQIARIHKSIKEHEEALKKYSNRKLVPKLNPEQERILNEAGIHLPRVLGAVIHGVIMDAETARTLRAEAAKNLPRWIVARSRYLKRLKKGEKPRELGNAIYYRVDKLARSTIIKSFKLQLGITFKEANLLASLTKRIKELRGEKRGRITEEDMTKHFESAFKITKEFQTYKSTTKQKAKELLERLIEYQRRNAAGERFERFDT